MKHEDIVWKSIAENTRKSYKKGIKIFENWCKTKAKPPLEITDNDACEYINYLFKKRTKKDKQLSIGTIQCYISAVKKYYEMHEKDNTPFAGRKVKYFLNGMMRENGRPQRRVKPLTINMLIRIINKKTNDGTGLRDKAILSLGFMCALRRSELINLRVKDLNFISKKKAILSIKRSKTDRRSAGHNIPIIEGKNLLLNNVKDWLAEYECQHILKRIKKDFGECPLFSTMRRGGSILFNKLHTSDIPYIVRNAVKTIGKEAKEYSGHSLRAGFVTSAIKSGARLDKIMVITRHKNLNTLMKYNRNSNMFESHAGLKML